MMPSQINDMLDKIDEVRTVFVMGQRSLPFLEELFRFLKEISPILDEINHSIEETTNKMPRATTQLQSVSEANRLATTEILDLVDAVMDRISDVRTQADQGNRLDTTLADADERILRLLRDSLQENNAVLLADVEQLFQRKEAIRKKRIALTEPTFDGLEDIRNRISRIMLALQVQDITAQQIAAVNHLIESIRSRMHRLVSRINHPGGEGAMEPADDTIPSTFNPYASYDHSPDRQALADAVFDGRTNETQDPQDPAVEPAPVEFKALQSSSYEGNHPASSTGDSVPTRQPGGDGYAGFPETRMSHRSRHGNGAASGEKASQDEIDRLFQGDK